MCVGYMYVGIEGASVCGVHVCGDRRVRVCVGYMYVGIEGECVWGGVVRVRDGYMITYMVLEGAMLQSARHETGLWQILKNNVSLKLLFSTHILGEYLRVV